MQSGGEMNARQLFLCLLGPLALQACGIIPLVKGEFSLLVPNVDHRPARSDEVKVLIFNASNPVWSGPNSGKDLWLNGKGVGRLETGQYLEFFVSTGSHEIKILHQDVFDFYSTHPITITASSSIVEICSTLTSNRARVLSNLPDQFKESFTPIQDPPTSYFGLRGKPFFETRLDIEKNRGERQFCGW
jgi:hypothetical protein